MFCQEAGSISVKRNRYSDRRQLLVCAVGQDRYRTVGGSGFHIPSYVAIDKGFLKAEGLDANFIAATAGVLVRATIAKEIEFTPIPGGGSEAMLKGAPLVFFVGESLVSTMDLDDDAGYQTG